MKKYFFLLLCILFTLNIGTFAYALPTPPVVKGDGVVLMDGTTGEVLFEKNMDAKLPPASTTKVMTALLTLERANLSNVIRIGRNPCNADGTAFGFKEGEFFSIEQLLNILLIGSCNDAAEALAEHISGSNAEFAKLMNKRAAELGATNTNFLNPSGLYEKDHFTSAKDLSLIMRELLKHKEFAEITQKPNFIIHNTNLVTTERGVYNKDPLVQKNSWIYYKDCIGGKNGYTTEAKHSFIAAAKRGNQTLIVTILHTDDKNEYFRNIVSLFDYGFNNFKLSKALNKNEKVKDVTINGNTVPLYAKDDLYYVKPNDSADKLSTNCKINNLEDKPFEKDDIVGTANLNLGTRLVGSVPLVAGIDKPSGIMNISASAMKTTNKFLIAGGSIVAVGLLFLGRALILKKRKKLRRKNKMRH